jgi:catalase (peroxidase I)
VGKRWIGDEGAATDDGARLVSDKFPGGEDVDAVRESSAHERADEVGSAARRWHSFHLAVRAVDDADAVALVRGAHEFLGTRHGAAGREGEDLPVAEVEVNCVGGEVDHGHVLMTSKGIKI